MKTKKIKLTSHYYGFVITLRVNAEKADKLFDKGNTFAMDRIDDDCARWYNGVNTKYLSVNQCRRIERYFATDNIEYFDKAELINN